MAARNVCNVLGRHNVIHLSILFIAHKLVYALFFHSGLGYVAGSEVTKLANDWKWALRVRISLHSLMFTCRCLCVCGGIQVYGFIGSHMFVVVIRFTRWNLICKSLIST